MTPLTNLLRNKLLLQKNFHTQEISINEWPFWMFEENIKLINELNEEELEQRKKIQEEKTGKKEIKLGK
jgi:hypothetical protein